MPYMEGGYHLVITILVSLWLLFGVNEKLLTQHILGLVTKYKLFVCQQPG